MSEIQKVLNLIRGGGGRGVGSFQKVLKFKKFWIIRGGGGGVKPNWEFFPNFPVFFLVMAPLTFETKLYIAWIFTWFQVLYDHILMWWKISCWESCISYCQAQLQSQLCWAEIAFVSTFTCNIMNPNPNLNLTPTPTLVCMFTFTSPFFFSILWTSTPTSI